MKLTSSTGELLIGADPELFVKDSSTNQFVSAHDIFPGSKYDPFFVREGAIQVDGVAGEFNINPAKSSEEFVDRVSFMASMMSTILKTKNPNLVLEATPVALFDKEYFNNLPADAKLLGCEPDYNAYTKDVNVPPKTTKPFRTGAGHLHLGWTKGEDPYSEEFREIAFHMVRELDSLLYVPSHIWDTDYQRRSLYGAKGSCRIKSYGVEYRPLSNAWVTDPDIMTWIFDSVQELYQMNLQGDNLQTYMFTQVGDVTKLTKKELRQYVEHLPKLGFPEFPHWYLEI